MKLNNLQILRGISALLVCCFHFRAEINFPDIKAGEILFKNGSIGVPIFFVISGFIMAFTTRKLDLKQQNTSSAIILFFKRRIIRIVPLYYLLTFAWIALSGSLLMYFSDYGRLLYSLLFLPQKDSPPVLYLGWSLNFEMFFYIIFGISLLFKKSRYYFIITFFIVSYILGKIFLIENPFWQLVTNSLNLYFVMGILLSILLNNVKISAKSSIILSAIGITLFSLLFFNLTRVTNELLTLLIVSGFVFSFLLFDYVLKIKGNRFLIFMGDISYSLYLSHPFVEVFFRRFKVEEIYAVPFFIFKILFVIAVASILYYFIEKKMTNYLKLKLKA